MSAFWPWGAWVYSDYRTGPFLRSTKKVQVLLSLLFFFLFLLKLVSWSSGLPFPGYFCAEVSCAPIAPSANFCDRREPKAGKKLAPVVSH